MKSPSARKTLISLVHVSSSVIFLKLDRTEKTRVLNRSPQARVKYEEDKGKGMRYREVLRLMLVRFSV